jgi:hypothetical protein
MPVKSLQFSRVLIACSSAAIVFFWMAAVPRCAMGGIVFESASSVPANDGAATDRDDQFIGSRFVTTKDFNITGVGGGFRPLPGEKGDIFLAITPIASIDSFPDPMLSGSIFQGIVNVVPTHDGDYTLSAHFNLPAGAYAITSGSGLFGATGVAGSPIGHPSVSGAGDFDIIFRPNAIDQSVPNYGTRFYVLGTPGSSGGTTVPLPPAIYPGIATLLLMGGAAWLSTRRKLDSASRVRD